MEWEDDDSVASWFRPSPALPSPPTSPLLPSECETEDPWCVGEFRRSVRKAKEIHNLSLILNHDVTPDEWSVFVCDLYDTTVQRWRAEHPDHSDYRARKELAGYGIVMHVAICDE